MNNSHLFPSRGLSSRVSCQRPSPPQSVDSAPVHYFVDLTPRKLPDFAMALELYVATPIQPSASTEKAPPPPLSPGTSQSRALPGNRLRYTAYETPRPTSRLSSSHSYKRTSQGSVSDAGSSRLSVDSHPSDDHLSRTVTAGELALMARDKELESISKVCLIRIECFKLLKVTPESSKTVGTS